MYPQFIKCLPKYIWLYDCRSYLSPWYLSEQIDNQQRRRSEEEEILCTQVGEKNILHRIFPVTTVDSSICLFLVGVLLPLLPTSSILNPFSLSLVGIWFDGWMAWCAKIDSTAAARSSSSSVSVVLKGTRTREGKERRKRPECNQLMRLCWEMRFKATLCYIEKEEESSSTL